MILDAPQRQRCNGLVANGFRNGRPQRGFCARHPLRNAATVAATSLPQRRNGRNGNGRNAGPECCIFISVQPRRSPEALNLMEGPPRCEIFRNEIRNGTIRNGNGNGRNVRCEASKLMRNFYIRNSTQNSSRLMNDFDSAE